MASSDVQILVAGAASLPVSYQVPNAQELEPLAVAADFNGAGAAGSFLPTLVIQSDAGLVVARVPVSNAVAAGGSASVTWAPFLRGEAASSGGGGGFSGGQPSTIAQRGAFAATRGAGTGNPGLFYPAGLAAGDLVLAFFTVTANFSPVISVTPPPGWKPIYAYTGDMYGYGQPHGLAAGFYYIAAGGEHGGTTFNVQWSVPNAVNQYVAAIGAYSGVDPTAPGSFLYQQVSKPQGVIGASYSLPAPMPPVGVAPAQFLTLLTWFGNTQNLGNAIVGDPAGTTQLVALAATGGDNFFVAAGATIDAGADYEWSIGTSGGVPIYQVFELVSLVLNPALA